MTFRFGLWMFTVTSNNCTARSRLPNWSGWKWPRIVHVRNKGFIFSLHSISNYFRYLRTILNLQHSRTTKTKHIYTGECDRKSTTITTRSAMRIFPMIINLNKECECKQTQGRPLIFKPRTSIKSNHNTDALSLLTFLHEKLNTRLKKIIHNEFYFKNGRQRYKFIVLGHELTCFIKHEMKSKKC